MKCLISICVFLILPLSYAQQVIDFTALQNPFEQTCNLQFKVLEPSIVSLKVLDIGGQEIHNVFSNKSLSTSTYIISVPTTTWADGVYFALLKEEIASTEGISTTIKLIRKTGETLSIKEESWENIAYFDVQNSCIYLPKNDQVLDAYLVNMNGQVLARNPQVATHFSIDNIPNGMYVAVFLRDQKVVYQLKFVK